MSALSAANKPFTQRRPRDGGQSMSIKSYRTPDKASFSLSWAPSGSLIICGSRAARRWLPGIRSGRSPLSGQFELVTALSAAPALASLRTSSIVRSAPHTASPVEAFACGSKSTTRTLSPKAAAASAKPSVTVVLPTPPF